MEQDKISVIEAAKMVGLRKQRLFKIITRLGIQTTKERSDDHKGQAIAYISAGDMRLIRDNIMFNQVNSLGEQPSEESSNSLDSGVFYLIQLEPEHDPGRFKAGFATNIDERLRSHRCSAPFAILIKAWPCKRLWERTAMDCITISCEQLHTEVFRTDNLDNVINLGNAFFSLMPELSVSTSGDCD